MNNASQNENSGTVYYHAGTQTVDYSTIPPPPPYSATVPTVTSATEPPVVQNTVIVQPTLKSNPIAYNCPNCFKRIVTRVIYINTRKTHMTAGFICGFTFWCLLCCLAAIPYIIPTFKKTEHYCPNCNAFLGSYSL